MSSKKGTLGSVPQIRIKPQIGLRGGEGGRVPTLGVADEVHPLKSLCHDGGHSLSEPLHLFPQGSQTLSPIEEIEHCHRSPRVCLWEAGDAAAGMDYKDPPPRRPPAGAHMPIVPSQNQGSLAPQFSPRQHQLREKLGRPSAQFPILPPQPL